MSLLQLVGGRVLTSLDISLKWKPPSENSIDFKVELRFPPLPDSDEPDYSAKPEFLLNTWLGGDRYEFFDFMAMTDEEWQR